MKTTEKQLALHVVCNCGQEYTSVDQTFLTHREMKAIGAKKHKKDCYSLNTKSETCYYCAIGEDLIF